MNVPWAILSLFAFQVKTGRSNHNPPFGISKTPVYTRRPPMPALARPSLCLFFLLISGGVARADTVDPVPSPLRGVMIPGGGLAGDADATALELNPGQLGLIEGTTIAYTGNTWRDSTQREGRGLGFFLAAPVLGSRLVLGGGIHSLSSTQPYGQIGPADYWKMQVGLALRGQDGGFGVTWDRLLGDRLGGMNSLTFGVAWHIHRALAFGAVVRDVGRPRVAGVGPRVPLSWENELAVRPFLTNRFELALGGRWLAGSDGNVLPYLRLAVTVMPGLALFAQVTTPTARTTFLDEQGTSHNITDFRGSAGLTVSFDRTSIGAAAIGGLRPEAGADGRGRAFGPGAAWVMKHNFQRQPALIDTLYVARLRLGAADDDRAFVAQTVALRRLADDPSVAAVLLDLNDVQLGLGRIEELRELITALRTRKPVLAYLTHPVTRDLYLASACSHVMVHPAGSVSPTGLGITVTYFKTLLDDLGVNVNLVRIADWKGAMEPFVFTESTEPVRANRESILDEDFGRIRKALATGPGRHIEKSDEIFERGFFSPFEAKKAHLVDEVVDEREVDDAVARRLGRRRPIRDADASPRVPSQWRSLRVAVVLIDGVIMDGDGGLALIGPIASSERIIRALAEARRDNTVRAVVLRVNSPGGDAFASDRIARAVGELKRAGKPVIVSMGDVAGSGGYYVAAPGDLIYAAPSTITGSIGIFGFKVDIAGLAARLGLGVETTKRGPFADVYSVFAAWSDAERTLIENRLRYFYELFISTVVEGRRAQHLSRARVDELGRGHLFTGAQARDVGLVDRLGGLGDAIDEAARRAHVPLGSGGLPELVVLPPPPADPLAALLALKAFGVTDTRQPDGLLGLIARQGRAALRLMAPLMSGDSSGVQARIPYEIDLR